MTFIFRADSSATIGFGHVARVLALAEAVVRRHERAVLLTRQPSDAIRKRAATVGVDLLEVPQGVSGDDERRAIAELCEPDSVVVVDGYAYTADWLRALTTEKGGGLVAYVDDRTLPSLACDVVINPNVSSRAEHYPPSETLVLAGPEWSIVGDRFLAARSIKEKAAEQVSKLLVTMGGADPTNQTATVIEALARLALDPLQVRIVIGMSNSRIEDLQRQAPSCHPHEIHFAVGVDDMAAQMSWADVAVTASGVTATELACVGVPGVTFAIVDNQEPIARALAEQGMFTVLPSLSPSPDEIAAAVEQLASDLERRRAMFIRQRATIDGKGKERVVDRLLASAHRSGRQT